MKTAKEKLTNLSNEQVITVVNQIFDIDPLEEGIGIIIPGSQGVDAHLYMYDDEDMSITLYEYIMLEMIEHFQELHKEFEVPFNAEYYRKLQKDILYLLGRKIHN